MRLFCRLITGLFITCLFITACAPVTTPVPTSTQQLQLSATPLSPTDTPFPTDTTIPLLFTRTAAPSLPDATSTPTTPTPNITPVPGPELITYLPAVKDIVDKCATFEYSQTIAFATLSCTMTGVGTVAITVTPKNKPVVMQDIQTLTGYDPIPAPAVGQGSQAFQSDNGKTTVLQFYKGNVVVRITFTGSQGYPPMEKVFDEAKKIEALLPQQITPPAVLSFPNKLAKDKLQDYFKSLVVSVGPARIQSTEIARNEQVCLTEYAQKPNPREFYEAALVDMQNNAVVKKAIYQMRYKIHCGGLRPTISAKQFKVGDKYEIRVAVGDEVVAIFPLVTK
jgi:hypothetical protein